MTQRKTSLVQDYTCPKCRGRSCDSREVVLQKTSLFGFLTARDNRYVEVTCMLCGYTEFFNRALYIKSRETADAREKIPLPENVQAR